MDKNSLIGLGIIAIIMGGWLYMSGPSKEQIARNNKIKDSISLVQKKLEIIEARLAEIEVKIYELAARCQAVAVRLEIHFQAQQNTP